MQFIDHGMFAQLSGAFLDESSRLNLERDLERNPAAGDLIKGTGGARKIRVALKGQGKRGGARVIYFYKVSAHTILFLAFYKKNAKETLTGEELKMLKECVQEIKRDEYP